VKRLRRELARINTLVRQREREQELPKGGLVSKEKSVRDEIGKGYSKIQERYGKRL